MKKASVRWCRLGQGCAQPQVSTLSCRDLASGLPLLPGRGWWNAESSQLQETALHIPKVTKWHSKTDHTESHTRRGYISLRLLCRQNLDCPLASRVPSSPCHPGECRGEAEMALPLRALLRWGGAAWPVWEHTLFRSGASAPLSELRHPRCPPSALLSQLLSVSL